MAYTLEKFKNELKLVSQMKPVIRNGFLFYTQNLNVNSFLVKMKRELTSGLVSYHKVKIH